MSEKKTIKDYIIAGITLCLFLVPEVLKWFLMGFYATLFFIVDNIIRNTDTSGFGVEQILLIGFIYLLSPIGAYFFYDKTVGPELYKELMEHLSQTESVIKFKIGKDEK